MARKWEDLTFEEKKKRFQWRFSVAGAVFLIGGILSLHYIENAEAGFIALFAFFMFTFGLFFYWYIPHSVEKNMRRK